MVWCVLALGLFNVIMSFIMQTTNTQSAVVFKVIPFFLGAITIVFVLKSLNII